MYQTTSATSIADLIDKIAIAAVAAGWILDRNVFTAPDQRTVTLHKSGDYIHLYPYLNQGVYLRGSVGYDPALTPDTETLKSDTRAHCNTGVGPFGNVYFFSENSPTEHFHCVIELPGALYRHLTFGELVKTGAYTGGTYFDAQNIYASANQQDNPIDNHHHQLFSCAHINGTPNSGGVRVDADGAVNSFASFRPPGYSARSVSGGLGGQIDSSAYSWGDGYRTQQFYQRSVNSWSGQTPLQHIQIKLLRPGAHWSIIGEVPNIRYLNMARFSAGEEFTIASDTYKVFPWTRQGWVNDLPYSYEHAFAYKKVL